MIQEAPSFQRAKPEMSEKAAKNTRPVLSSSATHAASEAPQQNARKAPVDVCNHVILSNTTVNNRMRRAKIDSELECSEAEAAAALAALQSTSVGDDMSKETESTRIGEPGTVAPIDGGGQVRAAARKHMVTAHDEIAPMQLVRLHDLDFRALEKAINLAANGAANKLKNAAKMPDKAIKTMRQRNHQGMSTHKRERLEEGKRF
jgi:hypothetical protein